MRSKVPLVSRQHEPDDRIRGDQTPSLRGFLAVIIVILAIGLGGMFLARVMWSSFAVDSLLREKREQIQQADELKNAK